MIHQIFNLLDHFWLHWLFFRNILRKHLWYLWYLPAIHSMRIHLHTPNKIMLIWCSIFWSSLKQRPSMPGKMYNRVLIDQCGPFIERERGKRGPSSAQSPDKDIGKTLFFTRYTVWLVLKQNCQFFVILCRFHICAWRSFSHLCQNPILKIFLQSFQTWRALFPLFSCI